MSGFFESAKQAVSNATSFISRHKGKIFLGSVAVGGYLTYVRVKPIWDELQSSWKLIKEMEEMSRGSGDEQKQALLQKFRRSMEVASMTVRDLAMKRSRDELRSIFDIDSIRNSMKRGTGHNLEVWNRFKVEGFSRTITAMYHLCILNMVMKIQLSVISRHTVVDGEEDSKVIHRKYLDVFSAAQSSGMKRLAAVVEAAVSEATKECVHLILILQDMVVFCDSWKLDTNTSFEDLLMIIRNVRQSVEDTFVCTDDVWEHPESIEDDRNNMMQYIFPPDVKLDLSDLENKTPDVPPNPFEAPGPNAGVVKAVEMCEETKSLFRTASSISVLKACFDRQFDILLNKLQVVFATDSTQPFAKIIVRISKIFDTEILSDKPNALSFVLKDLQENEDVDKFCSIVFFPLNLDTPDNPVLYPLPGPLPQADSTRATVELLEDGDKQKVMSSVENQDLSVSEALQQAASPPQGVQNIPRFQPL